MFLFRRFILSCACAVLGPPPARAHDPAPSPSAGIETINVIDVADSERPLTAASAQTVRDQDFKLRPISRPSDLLRVTPGLMIVQHAGGGKANQYLLRGFDADHGTDVALSFDGLPINMVSHAHGQGYADTNFIIPELISRVDVSKGPYFAELGDFANAGAIELSTRRAAESQLSASAGSFNTVRTLAIAAPPSSNSWHPLLAAELVRTNGPFENPENFNKHNLYGKLTCDLGPQSELAVAASSYAGSWNASGQIPARAVSSGQVGFYGSLDPSEGGASSRHNLYAKYTARPDSGSQFQALAFATIYDFTLYSNFTFFSRDPDNGDQIEQSDHRTITGGSTRYRWIRSWRGIVFDSSVGGNARSDSITNGLHHTRARERLAAVADDDVRETAVGLFLKEDVQLFPWLRLHGGIRADQFNFQVKDRLEYLQTLGTRTSGARGARRLSPKASLIISPHHFTDIFFNFGYGFHSNDARGTVRSTNPVTPLTRTVGYEVGVRTRQWDGRAEAALSLWGLDVDSETVWVGDEGTTEAGAATRRVGAEFEGRFHVLGWLYADVDVTVADAKFRHNAGNANAVALAPRLTAAGGLSVVHPAGVRAGLRGLYIARRPATEDRFLHAQATALVDAFAAYRWRAWELGVTVENLFNHRSKSAQFATVTRLPGEAPTNAPPAAGACLTGTRAATQMASGNFSGCEDISFSPGTPLSVRATATYYF